MSISNAVHFINYPEPREGPPVPYENEPLAVPAFRGIPLAIGAVMYVSFMYMSTMHYNTFQKLTNYLSTTYNSIQKVGFVQSYLWRDAHFDVIHKIPEAREYSPRYDPTVIPSDKHLSDITPREKLPNKIDQRKGSTGYYSSADYHVRYKSGELTPTEVVEGLLPLIRRDTHPPGKHSVAFIETQEEAVLAAAAGSTQRYKKGYPLGPLDGVPVAVKDEVDLKGYKRTFGTKLTFDEGSNESSWCVKKWEEAGAIVLGKTTMHELGLGEHSTA